MSNSVYRIGSPYMQRRFQLVCKAMGWNCEGTAWSVVTGWTNHKSETIGNLEPKATANVGFTFIQRSPHQKPFYRIVQITSVSGNEKQLCRNYTSSELAAWFEGVLSAQETLVKLLTAVVRSVDSKRGNEAFAANAIERSL